MKTTFQSKYNGKIVLMQKDSKYSLLVDSFTESGPDIEEVWSEAFEKFIINIPDTILILGFGAGSIMKPIRQSYPDAVITAVEIDPVMITLAKKYFKDHTKNVDINIMDARKFVKRLSPDKKWDLIIVDCYIGGDEPFGKDKLKFLLKLKTHGEQVLFNQLFLPGKKSEMAKLTFLRALDAAHPAQALKLQFNIIIEY